MEQNTHFKADANPITKKPVIELISMTADQKLESQKIDHILKLSTNWISRIFFKKR